MQGVLIVAVVILNPPVKNLGWGESGSREVRALPTREPAHRPRPFPPKAGGLRVTREGKGDAGMRFHPTPFEKALLEIQAVFADIRLDGLRDAVPDGPALRDPAPEVRPADRDQGPLEQHDCVGGVGGY